MFDFLQGEHDTVPRGGLGLQIRDMLVHEFRHVTLKHGGQKHQEDVRNFYQRRVLHHHRIVSESLSFVL